MTEIKVPTDKPKVQAYVGDRLRDALGEDAAKKGLSISAEVSSILEKYKDGNHFLIRLPEKIKEVVTQYSNEENRSVENFIEWIVIQYVNDKPKSKD